MYAYKHKIARKLVHTKHTILTCNSQIHAIIDPLNDCTALIDIFYKRNHRLRFTKYQKQEKCTRFTMPGIYNVYQIIKGFLTYLAPASHSCSPRKQKDAWLHRKQLLIVYKYLHTNFDLYYRHFVTESKWTCNLTPSINTRALLQKH